ncbi:putative mediator of RNA polymerase II transcription subunit 26 isoform X2 [Drosophila innubila]|uniref:putative mediator of RNA polymerase II transcription subunit 26 isoform X2 n=1 Tax=Drosophila innubila TaxID=198719 RepID=UPI00148D00F8|nr:putative mediator of RNA polymerase II transcription subunit 26 isoform X2 [Drosophila innubila]
MNIFNNTDLIELNMEDENICNDEINCANIFAAAASNKENINNDALPLNWNNGSTNNSPDIMENDDKHANNNEHANYTNNGSDHLNNCEDLFGTAFQTSVPLKSQLDLEAVKLEKPQLELESVKSEKLDINIKADNLNNCEAIFDKENLKRDAVPLNWNIGDDYECADVKPKLKLCWSICQSKDTERNDNLNALAPKAYNYQEVYQDKKERALRQRAEEERKAREFHSRPVPNFKAMHKQLEQVQIVHKITVPITPETVKHSIAYRERHKPQETMQSEQYSNDVARLARKAKLEMRPFHLRADQRVRERREYDASVQQNMALKKKEKDEERKQQELEQQRELRKRTEFKARPNPFK